jgi:hypothetical protein
VSESKAVRMSTQASTAAAIEHDLRELARRILSMDADELAGFSGLDFTNRVRVHFGVPFTPIERRAQEIFHEGFWARRRGEESNSR